MFTMHSWILFTSLHICCSCWKNHGLAWLSPPADWTGSTQHPATGRPSFLYCSILSATWSGNTNDIDRRCFITQQYNHSLPIVFLNELKTHVHLSHFMMITSENVSIDQGNPVLYPTRFCQALSDKFIYAKICFYRTRNNII